MPGVLWAETGDSALSSSPPFTGEAGFFSMKNGVLTAFPLRLNIITALSFYTASPLNIFFRIFFLHSYSVPLNLPAFASSSA